MTVRDGQLGLGPALGISVGVHLLAGLWWSLQLTQTAPPMAPPPSIQVRVIARPPPTPPTPSPVPKPPVVRPERRVAAKPRPAPRPAPKPAQPVAEPAPPVVDAAPLEAEAVAATPPAPTQATRADALADWRSLVMQRIAAEKRYPLRARRRGLEGTVDVIVAVGATGRVESVSTPGGAPLLLAHEAQRAVERASPFPEPPGGARDLRFRMQFDLDRGR